MIAQQHSQQRLVYTFWGDPITLDWDRPYWINDLSGELVCKFCNGRGDGSMLIPHHYDFCQRFPSWDLEECVRSMVRAVIVYILHVEVERCDSF